MQLNREARFDELMDYVHPSLFTLASREQMLEFFKKSFDNEVMHMNIDSIAVLKSSPDFKEGNTIYRKIDYWMSVTIAFKDSQMVNDPDFASKTNDLLKVGFPNSQIHYNSASHAFNIGTTNMLIAIRDMPTHPWYFLGYQKNEAFLKKLFPQSVIDHFSLL